MITVNRRWSVHLLPNNETVVVARVPDEPPDYYRICERHQYASHPVGRLSDLDVCPGCLAEAELRPGKLRYAVLHEALAQ